ncbi:Tub family protein [Trachipleistophora hominis]|uniref:Tub family protein n=1 Tax=Trachipleistophora hominis TaxID=72359 RepID=L7JVP1_TRAHO|nr:Tub family protein [Trachipleistophora hominis]
MNSQPFSFNAFNSDLLRLPPEKFKYLISTSRVNREVIIGGKVLKISNYSFSYHLELSERRELLVMNAYKTLFGYNIYTFEKNQKLRKIGWLKMNMKKNEFVLYEAERDTIIIKYANVMCDHKLFHDIEVIYTVEGDSVLERYRNNEEDKIIRLVNKKPRYNKDRDLYTLNYNNSSIMPSERNFQLTHPKIPSHINLSFGANSENDYRLNYTFPWNALQAFAISLSALLFES